MWKDHLKGTRRDCPSSHVQIQCGYLSHYLQYAAETHKLQGRGQITPLSIPVIEHLDMDGHGYGIAFNWGCFFLDKRLDRTQKVLKKCESQVF